MVFRAGTQVAGVFTNPRHRRRRSNGAAQLKAGTARALVVNSGNANAFTGKAGGGARGAEFACGQVAVHADEVCWRPPA